jgi:outer membrane immunogenic protein
MYRLVVASLTAAGLSVGLTAGASAADLGRLAPAKAPVAVKYSWTGGYGGMSGGSSWSPDDVNTASSGNSQVPPSSQALADAAAFGLHFPTAPKGFLGGGTLGYNVQTGQFVWGVEADLSWANIKGTSSQGATAPLPFFPGLTTTSAGVAEQKIDAFGTLRARLGFTPVDRLLVYGTGGLAYGHVESNTNIAETTNTGFVALTSAVGSASTWRGGWTVGAGLEYAFAPRWTAKAEYLYYDLGSLSYNSSSTASDSVGPFNTTGVTSTADFKGNIVRGGINYKFN